MNTQVTAAQEKLIFNPIKSNRHTAYGVLTDDHGNTFSIEVKGTNKADVEKFINYELGRASEGDGITTAIKPASTKKNKQPSKTKKNALEDAELYKQTSWRGLCVKVNLLELRNKSDKPQTIKITIDPPVESGKSIDFPFDQQTEANIKCDVVMGKVTIELFEFVDKTKTQSTSRGTSAASPGQPAEFNVRQLKTEGAADWNIKVTGATKSTFTLSRDFRID